MRPGLAAVRTLFFTELRMVLRDRRILVTSILLPLLLMPLIFLGSSWTLRKREHRLQQTVCSYAVTGSEAAAVRSLLEATRHRMNGTTNAEGNRFRFSETNSAEPAIALEQGRIHFYLEGISYQEALAREPTNRPPAGRPGNARRAAESEGIEFPVAGTPVIRIVFRADRELSAAGADRIREALRETRRSRQWGLLNSRGFTLAPAEIAAVREVDLASKGQVAGLTLGRTLTGLVVLFMLAGCSVVAIDSLAGEKERGTLETLLTSSARRVDIIAAKHLVILAIAVLIALIQALNLIVYVGFRLVPVPANLAAAVPPSVAVLLFLLFLPVAALIAGVLLLTSGYAKSYKEAQMYFFPLFLIGLVPAMTPFFPGLTLRSIMVLVPVANIALAVRDIMVGSFDWPLIAAAWLLTAAAGLWVTRLSVATLSAEKLITASDTDAADYAGGAALFSRHVLRWFAVLWAVLLMVNNYLEKADVRIQATINLVVLFFGASCLMLRRYRLNLRETLALRAPRLAVWPAVLLAVPAGLLTAAGLARLSSFFIPVSSKMMKEFDQAILPPGTSTAQLLFFLAVLPAVFEEITFRGLLLHGLSRRMHPALVTLVVGLIFGIFHVALFRFLPTAFLGVALAAVTLLTGSIFPAMVWHGLSNATSVLIYQFGVPLEELEPLPYVLGTALLAVALWIIWRHRTPYPGLLPWRTRVKP
jgi:sodium transport system permease protein